MAYKQFSLDERTDVTIYKRKSSRSLRLSVAADGAVRVSIPTWVPYKAGLEFARSRRAWIDSQRRPQKLLVHGQAIGKAHHLSLIPEAQRLKPISRIRGSEVAVVFPLNVDPSAQAVQQVAVKASVRALRLQAEELLPQRLAHLAARHDFDYNSVTIKQLKGRWGSCDQHKNIVLNLYLMQLPWELIDYVLMHELAHTRVLRHGPDFWQLMEQKFSRTKDLRRRMREHQAVLK